MVAIKRTRSWWHGACLRLPLVLSVFVIYVAGVGEASQARTCERKDGQKTALQSAPPAMAWPQVAKMAIPTVVSIWTTNARAVHETLGNPSVPGPLSSPLIRGTPSQQRQQGHLGSGVLVSPHGYVLTSHHVVADVPAIRVTLADRREFQAKVIGTDPMTDLAVLKLPGGGFPALPIGDSSHVEIAEPVMAIGHPFGLGHTVTMGIVSAVGRTNLGLAEHEEFIQTDATINPGDSGGALINSCGELIGINTALFSTNGSSLGIGFAIPANLARSVLEQLLAHGHVRRGWLGVVVQELSPALARGLGIPLQRGVLVTEVLQRNPAAQAGLNQNDVIIRFGESSIENSKQFGHMVTQIPPGNHVAVTVFRNGGETTLKVTVAERPRAPRREETTEIEFDQLGIVVTDLSLALAKRLGLPLTTQGVAVIDVLPGSTAQAAGLQSGDVVQQVNRQSIISIKDFERTVARTPSQPLVFFVKRKGMAMYVVIEPAG